MIKLFNSTDKLYSSNGDKIIIPTKAKMNRQRLRRINGMA